MNSAVAIVVLALLIAIPVVVRIAAARRHERASAARLQVDERGIVVGAEPIELEAAGSRAVLLLHGFADTPQTLRYLAAHLHAAGWTVHAPLLPGHGRTLRAFSASRAEDWVRCAREALAALRERYETVSVVGLSMGGSLATILAAEEPEVRALVLLAPYLSMPAGVRRLARTHWIWSPVVPYVRARGDRSIRDPDERAKNLNYGLSTPRLLSELATLVTRARSAAPRVAAPLLMVQSREDNRIPAVAAERAFALFGSPKKRIEWVEATGHVITVDFGRERTFEFAAEWLAAHAAAEQASARADAERPTRHA